MSLTTIIKNNASDLVHTALTNLCREEVVRSKPTDRCYAKPEWQHVGPRGMLTRELRWTWYCLTDVTRCACWLPGRKLNYPFMFAEFLWMFCGRRDVEMIGHYNENIRKFSDNGIDFNGAYGPPWRGQIRGVLDRLLNDTDSRQAIVGIWDRQYNIANVCNHEGEDFSDGPRMPVTKDVPCTLSMQYLIRDGKLEAGVVMRSSDTWLGLPYDIFNFAMLQRALAAELKIGTGALTLFVGSSHLYDRDIDKARAVLNNTYQQVDVSNVIDGTKFVQGVLDATRFPAWGLSVPGPPGLSYQRVMQAETYNRKLDDHKYKGLDLPLGEEDWVPFLTMLAHRDRKDIYRVHKSVRSLLD